MKFKKRMLITFLAIIILPLTLISLAYIGITTKILNIEQGYSLTEVDYTTVTESAETFKKITDKLYTEINYQIEEDSSAFNDTAYYEKLHNKIGSKNSYLVVRKGTELFYTSNELETQKVFHILPKYGSMASQERGGYLFNDGKTLINQVDFEFDDGEKGSIFLIIKINGMISRKLLIDMIIAILSTLVFTSIMLTYWIYKGVFLPINELKVAMHNIAEGNLDYKLPPRENEDSEIDELYKNYEEMRLRLKESTEENIQNEKQNRELISNISHDLKTPITAIKGYVEGIMDGVADTPEKMNKYIKTIYNKANDMDRLINELTLYSKIDNNRIPYNFHKINVADYFGDCIEEVGLDLESKNITLNYSNVVSPDTVIIADPEQMKRVINNIIGNSVKYFDKEKGIINIHILDEIDSIRVEIEDNGKGIASKDLPKIFERFYRTDASRNSSKGGSGIGLSIVKKIIEDHGGYIWATSKEFEGTCIHFVLRKYKEPEKYV